MTPQQTLVMGISPKTERIVARRPVVCGAGQPVAPRVKLLQMALAKTKSLARYVKFMTPQQTLAMAIFPKTARSVARQLVVCGVAPRVALRGKSL